MTQWLGALAALAEDPGSILSTPWYLTTFYNFSSRGCNALLRPPEVIGTHVVYGHMCRQDTHAPFLNIHLLLLLFLAWLGIWN